MTQAELLDNYQHVGKKDFDKSQTDKARAEKAVCKIAGVPSNEKELEKMVLKGDYAWSMKHGRMNMKSFEKTKRWRQTFKCMIQ